MGTGQQLGSLMEASAMTPRERMIATLNHTKPDRVPIELGWRDEVMEAVKRYYGVESSHEVAEILGADITRSAGIRVRFPEYEKRINGELSGQFGGPGRTVLHDERTFETPWGVVHRVGRDGKYLQWVSGPFVETDDLDSFDWPDEGNIVEDPELPERVKRLKEAGYWVTGKGGVHPFKQAWHMRGLENFLCDYLLRPEWVEAIYERILRFNLPLCRLSAAAGVDMISYWGDVAMQDRMLVPPDRWRSLDKQVWKTIISETRKVNPEVRFFFHSDGDIRPIVDDLIEVGFDIIDPIQPECINPAEFKARWGDKITMEGGGSVQRTLPFGTVEDVRREVDFLMRHCAYNGGYILRASNTVSFDCPVENVIAFYETARDYDLTRLQGPPAEIPDHPPCMDVEITTEAVSKQMLD